MIRRKIVNFLTSCFMPMVTLFLCQSMVKFCVDTGAEVNLIDQKSFEKLKFKPKLYESDIWLYGYNKSRIPLLGQFNTRIKSNGVYKSVKFYVTKGHFGNMLDYATSVSLGIISKVNNVVIGEEKKPTDYVLKSWMAKLPNLFSGKVGQLKDHMAD